MSHESARQWIEVRHPITGRLICKWCPQTMEVEHIDKGKRGVVKLGELVPVVAVRKAG